MRWDRARRAAGVVAAAGLLLLAGYLTADGALRFQPPDFFCFWTAGGFALAGRDPYDVEAWRAATAADPRVPLAGSPCGVWPYPFWTTVAFAPLALLPLGLAAVLWASAAIGLTIAGTAWSWQAARGPARAAALIGAIVVCSQPFWILLLSSQITGLTLALTGLAALAIARGRDAFAGFSLAALLLKPQIGGLVAPIAVARAWVDARRRVAVASLATTGAMAVLPFALAPAWAYSWVGEIFGRRASVAAMLPTAWGLGADVGGSAIWGLPLIAALAGCVLMMARRRAVSPESTIGLAVAVGLFATPHAWSYDHLVLALPWALVLARAERADGARRYALLTALVFCASFLPWVMYGVALTRRTETLSAIVPAATALVLAATLATERARS